MAKKVPRAAARDIFDSATLELVDRGLVRRTGPMRLYGRPNELDVHVEAEMWPDRTGSYFRVLWGIDRQELHDEGGDVGAEHSILGGDLKGLLERGRGILPIKLPGERGQILDFLPFVGSERPSTFDQAVSFLRAAVMGKLLPLVGAVQTRSQLAQYLVANREHIDRNGLLPEGEIKDLWAARLLIDVARIEDAVPHIRTYLRTSMAHRETRDKALENMRSAVAAVDPNLDLDEILRRPEEAAG